MTIRYFADNASPNAHPLAIQGDDSWNGLFPTYQGGSDGPKRNPAAFNMDSLQAGDEVLFANGSAWSNDFNLFLENPSSSSMARTNLIRFSSYDPGTGATGRPWFHSTFIGFMFNGFGGSGLPTKGGYLIEDIKFTGPGGPPFAGDSFGIRINPPLKWVIIRNCEISGFKGGIVAAQEANCASSYILVYDNDIHHCGLGGIEGCANWFEVRNNNMYGNGELHPLTHAIYCGSAQVETTGITFRHNHLYDNNIDGSGVCVGGNLTTRGMQRGVHIDDNRIHNSGGRFTTGAYGISQRPQYDSTEYHLYSKIRRNDIMGVQSQISVSSVPNVVISDNTLLDNGSVAEGDPAVVGIGWPSDTLSPEDSTTDVGAQVLRNTFTSLNPRNGTQPIWANGGADNSAGAGVVIDGNTIELGAGDGTSYAMTLSEVATTYASISNNTLTGGAGWQSGHASTAAFEAYHAGLGSTCTGNTGP